MIDTEDFQLPGTATLKNKLGLTDSDTLSDAVARLTARRLAELQAAPIRGGFDSMHLQEIHRYLYQDVFDWAGELRCIEKGGVPCSRAKVSVPLEHLHRLALEPVMNFERRCR